MAVRLLYGDDAQGRLVHVSQAARGRACGLFCPACRTPLVAKKGEVRVAHLAHGAADVACVGAVETVLHRLAKEVLSERRALTLPGFSIEMRYRGTEHFETQKAFPAKLVEFSSVSIEVPFPGVRLDALAGWARGRVAVEFRVSHATTGDKLARLRALGLAAIEIDLQHLARWDTTKDQIDGAVTSQAPREWLTMPSLFAVEIAEAWERWFKRRDEAWRVSLLPPFDLLPEERESSWEEKVRQFEALAVRLGFRSYDGKSEK